MGKGVLKYDLASHDEAGYFDFDYGDLHGGEGTNRLYYLRATLGGYALLVRAVAVGLPGIAADRIGCVGLGDGVDTGRESEQCGGSESAVQALRELPQLRSVRPRHLRL
jgi:hypothetical protein